jgi:PAS domain S-box-containing protein
MTPPLRILHLEDSPADAELARLLLDSEGIACDIVRVDSRETFQAALAQGGFDLILSDYSLPSFDGISALGLARTVCPETPFIFLSGMLGEDTAVKTLQTGATDYVLKHRLARLPAAIRRALQEAKDRVERKHMQTELRESHARLQAVMDNSPTMIFLKDTEGRYLLSNKEFAKITHRASAETVGKTDAELFPPEQAAAFRTNDREVLQAGTAMKFEEVALHDDGPHTSIVHKFPLCDASGKIYAIGGFVTDITERKRYEEKIHEQAALLDIAHDAILVHDLDYQITFWSKGAERVYGWTSQEALGKSSLDLLKPPPKMLEEARRALFDGGSWRGELAQVTKRGKQITVDGRWSLVRDAAGQPKAILKVNTDITEKKQLEAQFLRAQRMDNLGTLAGGIAHDLNNVLSPILMAVQLLRMQQLDEQCQQWLNAIDTGAKRGAQMVRQVLSFARGVQGERTILQLKHLVSELEKMARETFPRSIQISTNIPTELWTITGDSTQLYQVLMNLCVNARDAMPNGGSLKITANNLVLDEHYARMHLDAKHGPYVVLSVIDTGSGIPSHVIDKIFDPFFTTKELGKGTGLGLSTVLGIVKSHGGFVNVYSEVGKGTEFKVYLPAETTAENVTAKQDRLTLPVGEGQLVLVADDEAAILDMTKMTLEAYGYRVLTAGDGTEAISVYANHKGEIEVVITDMMMPYMDGPATIRALQKLDPRVKVIAVSGLMGNEKVAEVAGNTPVTFLQKPYTAETLLTTLHQVVTTK